MLFEQPWDPPSPDFIRRAGLPFNSTTDLNGLAVDWWTMDFDGGFGCGFYESLRVPAAFWFAAIDGWTWQAFTNFRPALPPADTWEVPASCATAQQCVM